MLSLQLIIDRSLQVVLDTDVNHAVRSIYIGGTVLPVDRTPESDVDLLAIVGERFEEQDEDRINIALASNRCDWDCSVKLRAIYRSELSGGPQRGFITKLIPAKTWLKRIPHFVLAWGDAILIEETIGPNSNEDEVQVQVEIIRSYISDWRADPESFSYEWIPKAVLYLCSIDSEARFRNEFTISFSRLERQLSRHPNHIVHASLQQRKNHRTLSAPHRRRYVRDVERYLEEITDASTAWETDG